METSDADQQKVLVAVTSDTKILTPNPDQDKVFKEKRFH